MRTSPLICFVGMCCGRAWAAEPSKPNVVFVLADDLGWTELGCQGSKFYETPYIDRLAQQGMRLTSAYTCGPNCTPTRAALMTGKYGARTGIYTVGAEPRGQSRFRKLVPVTNETRLPLEEVTLAEVLKGAGCNAAGISLTPPVHCATILSQQKE